MSSVNHYIVCTYYLHTIYCTVHVRAMYQYRSLQQMLYSVHIASLTSMYLRGWIQERDTNERIGTYYNLPTSYTCSLKDKI